MQGHVRVGYLQLAHGMCAAQTAAKTSPAGTAVDVVVYKRPAPNTAFGGIRSNRHVPTSSSDHNSIQMWTCLPMLGPL